MAKKGRKSRRFNLRKVRVAAAAVIGALAALDVTKTAATSATASTLRVISVDCSYAWSDKADIDDGAQFGWAHSDYSAAEIEECLEASSSIDIGDKVEQERANRLVREIGIIAGANTGGAGSGASFNQGMPVKTRLNWLLSIGDTLDLWVRNSSGVVYTTGSTLVASGNLWVKD